MKRVYEPPISPQPPMAPQPPPAPQSQAGRGPELLREVRRMQRRSLWIQGLSAGAATALALALAGAWAGTSSPGLARGLIWSALPIGLGIVLAFGVLISRRRVGDDARTARLLAPTMPELHLDLLAAVELSHALGKPADFSPELARAFLRSVDARAAKHDVRKLVSARGERVALAFLAVVSLGVLVLLVTQKLRLQRGWTLAFASTKSAPAAMRREPITGDFEVTYKYPAYSGLDSQTIVGTSGDLHALAGTEVLIKTRADRDVTGAVMVVNDQRVPLSVTGRNLAGGFVLERSGAYHVAFLDGQRITAEGPDLPIQVEADQPPQVHLTAPPEELEVDDTQPQVVLKYEATDDFGLKTLELVYKLAGSEQRVNLKPDDGRTTRGSYSWDLAALKLQPGDTITYQLEATDTDTLKGPKRGTTSAHTIKRYNAAEHRRAAMEKTEALWKQLIVHLADRLESAEHRQISEESVRGAQRIDERASLLATDFKNLGVDLLAERDPPTDIVGAVTNVGAELARDTSTLTVHHKLYLRLLGRDDEAPMNPRSLLGRDPTYAKEVGTRVTVNLGRDVDHTEKNVLYLESLLDRLKMAAIRDLAAELRSDRRELSRLIDEYAKTKEDAAQQALLQEMNRLRQRMMELQQRMAELAKGVRDDFMNREALQEMMESRDFNSELEDIEKMIRDGKAEDAMKKMQELASKMDQFLEDLEKAEDDADQQADPELARRFEEFTQNLDETTKAQDELADKTRALRDKYREQSKQRIAQQGAAMKQALQQKLDELERSYDQAQGQSGGATLDKMLRDAQQSVAPVKQALEANDFDLASEAAERLEQASERAASMAEDQRIQDERLPNLPEARRESKQLSERAERDAKKAQEVSQALRNLFPPPGSQLSDADKQQMSEMAKKQKQLEQRGQQLQQQMSEISERAPVFDEDAKESMRQATQRMSGAGQKLQGKDPGRGYGDQEGALQELKGLQQQLQQQASANRGKGGLPLPMPGQRGKGGRNNNEKVEIPDEDPNQASGEYRKDVMDAMKQGAPDRYREQNKKYYEELVK